jgi:hypothetical protein
VAKRDYVSLIATAIRQKVGPSAIGDEYTLNAKEIHEMIFRAVSTNKISFTQVYLALSDTDRAPEREDLFGGADMELEFGSYSRYERFALAEHYLQIRELERELHQSIRNALIEEFGPDEAGWWRNAVPEQIRESCAQRRERDESGAEHEPFTYTMLIDLKKIVQKQWSAVSERIDYLKRFNQQEFLRSLDRLNLIRNTVMHPVRIRVPEQAEFEFVEALHQKICL